MIKNDRIWPLWNNGGNSFTDYTRNFSIFPFIIRTANGKLTIRQIPVGGDTGRFSRMQIVTVG